MRCAFLSVPAIAAMCETSENNPPGKTRAGKYCHSDPKCFFCDLTGLIRIKPIRSFYEIHIELHLRVPYLRAQVCIFANKRDKRCHSLKA